MKVYHDWLPRETFGGRLHRLRMERGWSLQDLADRAGTVKGHIWNIESRKSAPGLRYVAKLARAFEMTVSELLDGCDLENL